MQINNEGSHGGERTREEGDEEESELIYFCAHSNGLLSLMKFMSSMQVYGKRMIKLKWKRASEYRI